MRAKQIIGPPLERFQAKVDYTDTCHLWTSRTFRGYGYFRVSGETWLVHRWIWTHTNGPIADGLHIDHLCEVKNCVNVAHMHLVTPLEHCHQPHSKWISKEQAARTHCLRGHKLEAPNLSPYQLRVGKRKCLSCARARSLAGHYGHDEAWIQEDADRRYNLLEESLS
jgi:hypothetical protein